MTLVTPIRLLDGYIGFAEENPYDTATVPTHFVYSEDNPDFGGLVERKIIPTQQGIVRAKGVLKGTKRWEGSMRIPLEYGGLAPLFKKIFGQAATSTQFTTSGDWAHAYEIAPAHAETVNKGLTFEIAYNQTAAAGNAVRYIGTKITEARFIIEPGSVVFCELDLIGRRMLSSTPTTPTFSTIPFASTVQEGSVNTFEIDISGGGDSYTIYDLRRLVVRIPTGATTNDGVVGSQYIYEPLRTTALQVGWEAEVHAKAADVQALIDAYEGDNSISMRLDLQGPDLPGTSGERYRFKIEMVRVHINEGADPDFSQEDGLALMTMSGFVSRTDATGAGEEELSLVVQNSINDDDYQP